MLDKSIWWLYVDWYKTYNYNNKLFTKKMLLRMDWLLFLGAGIVVGAVVGVGATLYMVADKDDDDDDDDRDDCDVVVNCVDSGDCVD